MVNGDVPSKSDPIPGYPSLAKFMASDRDRTALIFKRFDRLTARNLLYLESELADLQSKLDAYDEEDKRRSDMDVLRGARNWQHFKEVAQREPERMQLIHDIRSTMKEYKEALAYETILATSPSPDRKTLKAFRYKFHNGHPGGEESFPLLGGPSAELYDDEHDLLVLRTPDERDRLSAFVQDNFGYLFKVDTGTQEGSGRDNDRIGYASGDRISRFVAYLSTILAALLLVGAIAVLYTVKSEKLKLGLIGLFTAVFAASVGVLTNARRAEIFGATAAYAAVLVVFVSGNLGEGQ